MSNIAHQLTQLFEHHRIVFWYGNDDAELRREYTEVVVAEDTTKLEVNNNAFATKIRLLVDEPAGKFLVFRSGAEPAAKDNWLLDVQLAHVVLSTDRVSMYLQELKLDRTRADTVQHHLSFFGSKKRMAELSDHLPDTVATAQQLELGMLAVLTRSTPRLEDILLALLGGDPDKVRDEHTARAVSTSTVESEILRHKVDGPLWEMVKAQYGYRSDTPGVADFAKALFITRLSELLPTETARMDRGAARLLLSRWKDSERYRPTYLTTAALLAHDFGIEQKLTRIPIDSLERIDLFEEIDPYLIAQLGKALEGDSRAAAGVKSFVQRRETTFWYEKHRAYYEALRAGAEFLLFPVETLHLRAAARHVLTDYTNEWYILDAAYRRFHLHQRSAPGRLLSKLEQQIERAYTNGFLLRTNNHWQEILDRNDRALTDTGLEAQRDFWKREVAPYVERGNRIFVIISDGMRYETGMELSERLQQSGRYAAKCDALLAAVPTFTQLGMAALLPHRTLTLHASGKVEADGVSTQGTANRDKILKGATNGRAVAITAADFRTNFSPRDAGRAWVKNYDVVYIYLNLIDKAGENEEEQLFSRTEDSFQEVNDLLRIIARMNGNNVLITADHGYLYQQSMVVASDFADYRVAGDDEKTTRRFVLGSRLEENTQMMHFTSEQLGLKGEVGVVIPKSVQRLRQRGSGSRYVHGGMSLQELIVPLVRVSIGRTSEEEARPVDVELLSGVTRITTHQQILRFYQRQPVGGKRIARKLRIGFYNADNELVSEERTENFASEDKEERERELRIGFHFIDGAGGDKGRVILRVKDPAGAVYFERTFDYSISSDFDSFDI